jgi:hypothetical protein
VVTCVIEGRRCEGSMMVDGVNELPLFRLKSEGKVPLANRRLCWSRLVQNCRAVLLLQTAVTGVIYLC